MTVEKKAIEARQGRAPGNVRRILIVSIVLALVAGGFFLAWG